MSNFHANGRYDATLKPRHLDRIQNAIDTAKSGASVNSVVGATPIQLMIAAALGVGVGGAGGTGAAAIINWNTSRPDEDEKSLVDLIDEFAGESSQ